MTRRIIRGAIAALVTFLLVSAVLTGRPAAEPGPTTPLSSELQTLASTLADSIAARCSIGTVRVLEARTDGHVRIDRGSTGGLRPYSRVTLVPDQGSPWSAEIETLEETTAWLKPAADFGDVPYPSVGREARIRLDIARLAMSLPRRAGRGNADELLARWIGHVSGRLSGRHGFDIVTVPDYPDSLEWREVAMAAGADVRLGVRARPESGAWSVTLGLRELRRHRDLGTITVRLPIPSDADTLGMTGQWPDPPPGVRTSAATELTGPILDLLVRRWLWSDALIVFDDRIESWTLAEIPRRQTLTDLTTIWPAAVPTRWPVGEMIPVNTFYDMTGVEARVNYSLCSNQRPRYLTINIEKAVPESLNLVVSDGPLDSLGASSGGCFQQLDRVEVPAGFNSDPAMPATAVARLALEEIVRDRSGRPLQTESGQWRRKKIAVIQHDEATATLWLSTPAGGQRLPGHFGREMDEYRGGQTGPPGFLVTSDADAGQADHLEWWVLDAGRCEQRWSGCELPGSITAILCSDRDGDERDDVLVGETWRDHAGYQSRLHSFSSRPGTDRTQ